MAAAEMEGILNLKTRLDRRLKSGAIRTKTVGTRVTDAEEQELIAAANRDNQNVSEWTREVLLKAARRRESDAVLTEVIATRMLLVNLLKPLAMGKTVSQEWITEAMAAVRREKRKAAQEVYAAVQRRAVGGAVDMAQHWGRKETIIWPPHAPIVSYGAIAAALLLTCLLMWQRLNFQDVSAPAELHHGVCPL